MNFTFLGTGTSTGVPMIGCSCPVCTSEDSRDQRMRASAVLDDGENIVLIDTTPELRFQALRAKLTRLDAVLLTHAHADHIMGFDDLRRFCVQRTTPLPVYGSEETLTVMRKIFDYAFQEYPTSPGYVHARAMPISGPFEVGKWRFTPLPVPHGTMTVLGFLIEHSGIKRAAYLSDCSEVPESLNPLLEHVPNLIIDGLRDRPHPTHLSIDASIAIGQRLGAQRVWLTHLCHEVLHAQREAALPKHARIAYDGLCLSL